MPVTAIQILLGHAWLETTQIYEKANDRISADDYYTAADKIEGWQRAHASPCKPQLLPVTIPACAAPGMASFRPNNHCPSR